MSTTKKIDGGATILNISIVEMNGIGRAFVTSHPSSGPDAKTAEGMGVLLVSVYNAVCAGHVDRAEELACGIIAAAKAVRDSKTEVDRG